MRALFMQSWTTVLVAFLRLAFFYPLSDASLDQMNTPPSALNISPYSNLSNLPCKDLTAVYKRDDAGFILSLERFSEPQSGVIERRGKKRKCSSGDAGFSEQQNEQERGRLTQEHCNERPISSTQHPPLGIQLHHPAKVERLAPQSLSYRPTREEEAVIIRQGLGTVMDNAVKEMIQNYNLYKEGSAVYDQAALAFDKEDRRQARPVHLEGYEKAIHEHKTLPSDNMWKRAAEKFNTYANTLVPFMKGRLAAARDAHKTLLSLSAINKDMRHSVLTRLKNDGPQRVVQNMRTTRNMINGLKTFMRSQQKQMNAASKRLECAVHHQMKWLSYRLMAEDSAHGTKGDKQALQQTKEDYEQIDRVTKWMLKEWFVKEENALKEFLHARGTIARFGQMNRELYDFRVQLNPDVAQHREMKALYHKHMKALQMPGEEGKRAEEGRPKLIKKERLARGRKGRKGKDR